MIKTITTKIYNVRQLKRYHPEGFKHALETYQVQVAEDTYTMDEIMDSLKGLFEATQGIKLTDWEIGGYSYSQLSVKFDREEVETFKGARALAWIENNLISHLRLPLGRWGAPGSRKDCPFTGVCFDEDFIEALLKNIKGGMTLKDSFKDLADVARRLIEADDEYRREESSFIETAEANEYEFTREGKRI